MHPKNSWKDIVELAKKTKGIIDDMSEEDTNIVYNLVAASGGLAQMVLDIAEWTDTELSEALDRLREWFNKPVYNSGPGPSKPPCAVPEELQKKLQKGVKVDE